MLEKAWNYITTKHQAAAIAFDVSKTIWLNTTLNFLELRVQMEEKHIWHKGDIRGK